MAELPVCWAVRVPALSRPRRPDPARRGKVPLFNGLSDASWLRFTYDLGTTTTVLLRVEGFRELKPDEDAEQLPCLVRNGFRAVSWQARCSIRTASADGARLLQSVPAHSLPLSEQIDAAFPRVAKVILSEQHACVVLGLCCMLERVGEGTFLSVEHQGTRPYHANHRNHCRNHCAYRRKRKRTLLLAQWHQQL